MTKELMIYSNAVMDDQAYEQFRQINSVRYGRQLNIVFL